VKKLTGLSVAVMILLGVSLAACRGGGTPKAPISKLVDLDKLVTTGMSITQVSALAKTELIGTSKTYQASTAQQGSDGSWAVTTKQYGYKTGETGPYQVLLFSPSKSTTKYYAVFFKDNSSIGKCWFDSQGGGFLESLLQGKGISQTNP
jgi:hypothetical protein